MLITNILFLLIYVILVYLYLFSISRSAFSHQFNFETGLTVGGLYFLLLPLGIILLEGAYSDIGINAEPYRPYEDIAVTLNMFLGLVLILIIPHVLRFITKKYNSITSERGLNRSEYLSILKLMLFLYGVFSIYGALSKGIFETGAHWHDSGTQNLANDAFLIIFLNFSNCYRVGVFGLLLFGVNQALIKHRTGLLIGVLITFFDLFITFNRITALYFLLFYLFINLKNIKLNFSILLIVIPFAAYFSSVWTWFRGSATGSGFGLIGIYQEMENAFSSYSLYGDTSFLSTMNGVFESSNIQVFSHLVKNVGENIPIFFGETYFIRPLTTVIPSSLWSDKPKVFGSYLGELINNYPGLSLNSTLFGEVFTNFYWIWPIVFFLTMLALAIVYRYFNRHILGANYIAFFVGFALWRFDINFAFATMYSVLFIFAILKIIKFFYTR